MSWDAEAAAAYDTVACSALGRVLRKRVHEVVDPLIGQGARVLDLGAGTGLDVEHYLERGAEVTGVELSGEMLEFARQRVGSRARLVQADIARAELGDEPFDVVVSDFGVLNCVPSLENVAANLDRWCRPGGVVVLVVMGRWVPWEVAAGLRHAAPGRIARRWRGRSGEVTYWTPREIDRSLRGFSRRSLQGLGVLLPTFEQRAVVERRPRLLARLDAADRRVGTVLGPLGVGDHWLGSWERR